MAKECDPRSGLTRRDVLTSAGALAGGLALAGCKYGSQAYLASKVPPADPRPEWADARVRAYRPLGSTGFEISDVSFGSAELDNVEIVRNAVGRGINYFDTSPDYSNAKSERAIGEGIAGTPRDKLFVASKFCTPNGHLPTHVSVENAIRAVEDSLLRIGTDYIDLVHVHACNSVERLMSPNIHEAFDRLKEAGKVRFLGVSSHTPDLEVVMRHAVASDRFDVIMVAYNYDYFPTIGEIFHDAHQKGMGVMAMKTLKGAFHSKRDEFSDTEKEAFSQAALKWVLSNPDVSGLVISMNRPDQINEYLMASGQPFEPADQALLERYDTLASGVYCRPGCGACLDSCPNDVPIDDVLRWRMYSENYGRHEEASNRFAALDPRRTTDGCVDCAAPCASACPFDLQVKERLLGAAEILRGQA
jgi:predicted aldo/keto reductase-like oxidoreductase